MIVMRPHKIWSIEKTVTATPATNYTKEWVNDGNVMRPIKLTGGSGSIVLAGSAAVVDLAVLVNTNLQSPATVNVSGGFGAFTIPALRPGGIPYNPFIKLETPVNVASLTFTFADNPEDIIIGEILVGLSETWDLLSDTNDGSQVNPNIDQGGDEWDVHSIPPYVPDIEYRTLGGTVWADATEFQFIRDWKSATRGNSLPSIAIPDDDSNDAYAIKFDTLSWIKKRGLPNPLYSVTVAFTEFERTRF
jgi:hypothetical protein